jgi:hypothetical protein
VSEGRSVSPEVALGRYLEMVDEQLPGFVEGVYVVGSFALDDWQPGRSDLDVVVVTSEPASDDDARSLFAVHALLAESQPQPSIDGPYVAWGDLPVAPATGLHRPWTLDGRLQHDGECFEINPVTWYTLATYGVTVRGPMANTLDIWLDTNDRIRFVVDNLGSYWAGLAEQVRAACHQQPDGEFDSALFEWCALGALRLHYTAFTGDVTSKSSAGAHGLAVSPPPLHDVLRDAINRRASGDSRPVQAAQMTIAADLIEWVCDDVAAAR